MRRPKLIVSKCLDFQKCRYDGQGYNNETVSTLKEHADIKVVCPEVEMGLETPRNAIRIEQHGNELKLIQHHSNLDFSNDMNNFSDKFLSELNDIDGFILKSKSPSCGIKDVKIYHQGNKCSIRADGDGFFSSKVINKFDHLPIENEGRLKNYSIRDSFFTKIFAINNFKENNSIKDFHKQNYLLLNSYEENGSNELSKIVGKDNLTISDKNEYEKMFYDILKNDRNKVKKLDIIMKVFKRYQNKLSIGEVNMFNDLIKSYENEKIPFNTLAIAIRMHAVRFNDNELLNQSFFSPYPEGLVSICDSGKGRDL